MHIPYPVLMVSLLGLLWAIEPRLVLAEGRHALLIGIAQYPGPPLVPLDGPIHDVAVIRQVLMERFGFEAKDISVLRDVQATHRGVERAFRALADRVQPGDFVYLHYAGHGSYTPDRNGDERRGLDQTWVTHGARQPERTGKDHYDVLDDEINAWLIPIFDRVGTTGQVVFVSDSCHSASVTRGRPAAIRAVPAADTEHPLGKQSYPSRDFPGGVRIGAAGDQQAAAEFNPEGGVAHGLFTWYWAQALQQAESRETWRDIFQRARARVTYQRPTQQPQLKGQGADRPVFGGERRPMPPRVTVSAVTEDGRMATLSAGALAGVTVGSRYRYFTSRITAPSTLPRLTIRRVGPFSGRGKVTGVLEVGDALVEEVHAYAIAPIPVFINADFPEQDRALLKRIEGLFDGGLPGYTRTLDQARSRLVLYLLRPKRLDGSYLRRHPLDTLPLSVPEQPPQIWVLSDTEQLWSPELRIDLQDPDAGLRRLRAVLLHLARVHEVKHLTAGRPPPVELHTVHWVSMDSCAQGDPDCLVTPDGARAFRRQRAYTRAEMAGRTLPLGVLLTFRLENQAAQGYHAYLLNLGPAGTIEPIFPTTADRAQDAWLAAGEIRDFRTLAGLFTDTPGEETVKLLVTTDPIAISLLAQHGLAQQERKRGTLNPLERLLAAAARGTRSGERITLGPEDWGTVQYSFTVAP